MAEKSWGDLLSDHAPDLAEQNKGDHAFMGAATALSAREKYLIALVLDAAAGKPNGVRIYAERASKAGASKEQILDALRMLRMFCGRPVLATGAEALRQFDT